MEQESLEILELDVARLQQQSRYHNDLINTDFNLQIIKEMHRVIIRILLYIAKK